MHFLRYATFTLPVILITALIGCNNMGQNLEEGGPTFPCVGCSNDAKGGQKIGNYIGTASLTRRTSSGTRHFDCRNIQYRAELKKNSFKLDPRKFECTNHTKTFTKIELDLKDKKFYLNREPVGELLEKEFNISIDKGNGDLIYISAIFHDEYVKIFERHVDGNVEYESVSILDNMSPDLLFE